MKTLMIGLRALRPRYSFILTNKIADVCPGKAPWDSYPVNQSSFGTALSSGRGEVRQPLSASVLKG